MSRYITTKADFTLRRKHKTYSGATIYENDYTTINPMPNALKGEYVIGDSNFVFTSRLGINGQKKHVRGKFVPNPSGSTDERGAWTIDTIIDSGITEETRIRLKPDYTSIRDFACYGSAVKLIQGTVNGVITDFPAELWFSKGEENFNPHTITIYPPNNGVGHSFNELDDDENEKIGEVKPLLYNEYGIDFITENLQETSVYNPLRYFCLCGASYNLIIIEDGEEKEYPFTSFEVENTALGECYNGKEVEVDKLAIVHFNFSGKKFDITAYKDNEDGKIYYTYGGSDEPEERDVVVRGYFEQTPDETLYSAQSPSRKALVLLGAPVPAIPSFLPGAHIRPKREIIEEYFRTCDDFTYVILDRTIRPIYTATFETPRETETGYVYDMVSYTWPSLLGGYNPDLSGEYYSYVESLIALSEYYDEFHCDNMWRSLTHEAIKTLDWTYISNSDGDIQDMSTIDTSRIEPITKIYGRQFDDLKLYADNIKSINTITYNQRSNTPDYTLTDVLENSGWETKTLKITSDNKIRTKNLYPGLTSGYTASDANNEFLRRLKLNSQYLFSVKGTRKGLDSMLAMFGFTPDEYKIHEYVCVFTGTTFPRFCESTDKLDPFPYPLAKDVKTINKYKINFNALDPYGDYCGIPVTEVGFWSGGQDYSYVVPWYSQGKKYDDGLYFQMHGGWGKREKMDIDLELAPNVKTIIGTDEVPLYMETQARLKFAKDFDELLQEAYASSTTHDVFYVTDITNMYDVYTTDEGESIDDASHYFVLENSELKQFLGFSSAYSGSNQYGWRSINTSEILQPNTAGTLVLYLESIMDDTTGNNPHIGNGTYDDGMAYISGMSEIFAYSLVNKNFIGIDDDTCDDIKNFKFGVIPFVEDNRKCWFFSDNYNSVYGKDVKYRTESGKPEKDEDCGNPWEEVSEKITLREVDITDNVCNIRKCFDRSPFKKMAGDDSSATGDRIRCGDSAQTEGCTARLGYEITELLTGTNSNPAVGAAARNYFQETTVNYGEKYNRITNLIPFDPENYIGPNGEAAANSIVNVKNIEIEFIIPDEFCKNAVDKKAFIKYIETSVIPYLTQMIPSTTILKWTFKCSDEPEPVIPDIDIDITSIPAQCKNNQPSAVTVSANVEWSVTTNADWITITNKTANGFTVNVSDSTTNSRTGRITVKSVPIGVAPSRTIIVSQSDCREPEPEVPYIRVDTTPIVAQCKNNQASALTVSANIEWVVTTNVDWVTITNKTSNRFTVNVSNNTGNSRTGTITVKSVPEGVVESKTIVVSQPDCREPEPPAPEPIFIVDNTPITASCVNNDVYWVSVTAENTDWSVEVINGSSWITITNKASNGFGVVIADSTTGERNGNIKITPTADGLAPVTISVHQPDCREPEPTPEENVIVSGHFEQEIGTEPEEYDDPDPIVSGETVTVAVYARFFQNNDGTWGIRYWASDRLPNGAEMPIDFKTNEGDHMHVYATKEARTIQNVFSGKTTELGYMFKIAPSSSTLNYNGTKYVINGESNLVKSYDIYSSEYGDGFVAPIANASSFISLNPLHELDFRLYYGILRDLSDSVFDVDENGISARTINLYSYFVDGTSADTRGPLYKKDNYVRKFNVNSPGRLSLGFFRDMGDTGDMYREMDVDLIIYDSEHNDITDLFEKVPVLYNYKSDFVLESNFRTSFLYILKEGHTLDAGTYQITLK